KKVARIVIRWTTDAGSINSNLRSWLTQSANNAGRGVTSSNNRYPVIPAAIRELHLARMPNTTTSSSRSPISPFPSSGYSPSASSTSRIHASDVDAVIVALKSAYEVLPRDELLREIEHGHPLTRAAALAAGGGRLSAKQLPLILKFADDKDPKMQQAALTALMHFGEKEAVAKLVHFVQKNTPRLSKFAVASLAASRYSNAHKALIAILKNEPPKSRIEIVKILAMYPRPIWSETIYSFVKNEDKTVRITALKALGVIGHPQLVDVLKDLLQGSDSVLLAEAFKQIVQRTDARSEKIAMEYALKYLKKSPPSSNIYTLLRRTKDTRAVPLLLSHLERSSGSRSSIISVLAVIGDHTVAKRLVKLYPALKSDYERASILRALIQLKSPEFRKLAGPALLTRDSTLISAACEGLKSEGTKDNVKLLIDAFEKSTYTTAWSYISRALGELGTPAARAALRQGRESTNASKRNYSLSALNSLRQRSPGYQYIYQAQASVRSKKYKQAIQYFSLALKMDRQLSTAYSGRGHVHLRQMKVPEAKADFAAAIKLDPYDSLAIAGFGITLVLEGKYREGVKQIENNRSKFTSKSLFAYNSACVYGRAYEHLLKNKTIAGRDKKMVEYRDMAISELKRCVKLGYRNYAEMKIDPDLASLKNLKEFQQIHSPNAVKKKPAKGAVPGAGPVRPGAPPGAVPVKPADTAKDSAKKG
ncbi:MAG: HEAT repeat domain-containing protein, partial [Planctomycetes bacterium]|nr:HEAT repeat domain-containing protein [Planctomycetota bacterium]